MSIHSLIAENRIACHGLAMLEPGVSSLCDIGTTLTACVT